jgi:hypothetical protein
MNRPPHPRRTCDVFVLTCWRCLQEIILPCSTVVDHLGHCGCGAALRIFWREPLDR